MLHILLIEDSPADAQMIRTAVQKTRVPVDTHLLDDGLKAVEYFNEIRAGSRPCNCDLVLLDLNLPKLTGFEVLDYIRSSDMFKTVPVIVMSGSSSPFDVERAYRAGANSYIIKPTHLDDIFESVASLVSYWGNCVQLPSKQHDTVLSTAGDRAYARAAAKA